MIWYSMGGEAPKNRTGTDRSTNRKTVMSWLLKSTNKQVTTSTLLYEYGSTRSTSTSTKYKHDSEGSTDIMSTFPMGKKSNFENKGGQ